MKVRMDTWRTIVLKYFSEARFDSYRQIKSIGQRSNRFLSPTSAIVSQHESSSSGKSKPVERGRIDSVDGNALAYEELSQLLSLKASLISRSVSSLCYFTVVLTSSVSATSPGIPVAEGAVNRSIGYERIRPVQGKTEEQCTRAPCRAK